MEFVKTKTILSKVNYGNEWYGIDYNMNLYRGCCHGCIYCDSRSSCYHIDDFDVPRGKENALLILENELSRKKQKGVVGIGSMSDTYNPFELQYEQTRGALKLLLKYGFGVSIDTKSDRILRDLDLLKEINTRNSVIIKFTITTPHDELSRIIEPHVCVSSERFKALKTLSDNGIYAGIMLNPVLPFLTDGEEDIKKLIALAHENGARFIHSFMGVTLRENQRDYYYQQLDRFFPGLKEKYMKYYKERYFCAVPNYRRLYQVFTKECERYGILHEMSDIIRDYKKNENEREQISLF
ncbi:MAG: radical SAM protein [Erysipelotrichaceae bacterium]|nr:radical SAM protein [Erysipelotrichaceae bacterium]